MPEREAGHRDLSPSWKWLLAAWIVGTCLFAHGCHGDEDDELFGALNVCFEIRR